MVCKKCPAKKTCFDKGSCESCDFGKAIEGFVQKIERLKAKNFELQHKNRELEMRVETLLNPNF